MTADRPLLGWSLSDHAPVRAPREGPLLTIAPDAAVRRTACLVPTLRDHQGSCIVATSDAAVVEETARFRQALGQRVHVLDPFAITAWPTARLNPLDAVDFAEPYAMEEADALAALITGAPGAPQDPIWLAAAADWIAGLIAHVCKEAPPPLRTLEEVARHLYDPPDALDATCREMRQSVIARIRTQGRSMATTAPEAAARTLAMARACCGLFLGSPSIQTMTDPPLHLRELTNGSPATVYVVLPVARLDSHGLLAWLWLTVLLGALARTPEKSEPAPLVLLDDAAAFGRLPLLHRLLASPAPQPRLWTLWRDAAQVKAAFPENWATVANTAVAIQMIGLRGPGAVRAAASLAGIAPAEASPATEPLTAVVASGGTARAIRCTETKIPPRPLDAPLPGTP